jgi:RNA polymerase-binding transcription factor DksA
MEDSAAREQLQAERDRLEALRDQFAADGLTSESEGENFDALTTTGQHPANLGTETFDRERDLSILEQVEGELADIEHALARIEKGTYGTCEACGGPIEEERLEARPEARLCLRDQLAAEQESHRHATRS